MDTSKATARPWQVNQDINYDRGKPWIIWGPKGPGWGSICSVAPNCPPVGREEETAANAALIVQAVNSFDQMREVCRKLILNLKTKGLDGNAAVNMLHETEAALKLANGE